MAARMDLILANDLTEIARLADQVEAFCDDAAVPDGARLQVTLVLDELVTNAITYGYPDGVRHEDAVRVTIEHDGQQLVMTVTDTGVPFDPLTAPEPDIDAALDDRPIGGLGIHFLRSFMTGVTYVRDGGRNCVRFARRIDETDPLP
jgi:anti-sigma regulatory factor (Ser/Thr protein kinase)